MKTSLKFLAGAALALTLTTGIGLSLAGGNGNLPVQRWYVAQNIVNALKVDVSGSQYKNCFIDTKGLASESAICYLKLQGYVQGNPDGTFKPYNTLNRAEGAKLLNMVFSKYYDGKADPNLFYTDVAQNTWYYSYIKMNAMYGVIDIKPCYMSDPTCKVRYYYPAESLSYFRFDYILAKAAAFMQ